MSAFERDYGKVLIEKGLHRNVEFRLKFEPRDLWIGAYWSHAQSIESLYQRLDVYVCIVPTLPLRFRFEWGWK